MYRDQSGELVCLVLWNLNQWRIIEGFPLFAYDKQIMPFFQESLWLHLIQINNLEYQE